MDDAHYGFVVAMNGNFWNRLSDNASSIKYFVRRGAVAPTQTQHLLFYVGKRMQILGKADFVERIVGDTEDLWSRFGAESFFESADEYRAFAGGSRKMTFIRFENFQAYADPKPKNEIIRVLGSLVWFRPKYVSESNAELLDGNV